MPGLNRRGPMGQGPMTGRKMGRCTNFGEGRKKDALPEKNENDTELPDDFPGRGYGFGRGFRFGRRWGFGLGRGGRGRGMGRNDE